MIKWTHFRVKFSLKFFHFILFFSVSFFSKIFNLRFDTFLFSLFIFYLLFYNSTLCMFYLFQIISYFHILLILDSWFMKQTTFYRHMGLIKSRSERLFFITRTSMRKHRISSGQPVLNIFILLLEISFPNWLYFLFIVILFPHNYLFLYQTHLLNHRFSFLLLF